MQQSELKTLLEKALGVEDDFKRGWAYAKAVVRLGPVEELEMARAIINDDENLLKKAGSLDQIECETRLRKKWMPHLPSVDEALARYPRVAARSKGVGYQVALLAFSEFCICDVAFTCKLLDEVIAEFESGKDKVELLHCEIYGSGPWPRNHKASVFAAMAMFTQRPCWVLRHLFLCEVWRSGMGSNGTIEFQREAPT